MLDAWAVHQIHLPAGTPPSTLAQLYHPTTMPANLAKAHAALDKAVDAACKADGGAAIYANDGERVAFLFKRYAALTSLVLPAQVTASFTSSNDAVSWCFAK